MARKRKGGASGPVLAKNRAARHEFHILETLEAGIELLGTEVKSARDGRVNLKDAYGKIRNGEVFLVGAHISPYTHGNRENHDAFEPGSGGFTDEASCFDCCRSQAKKRF